MHLQVQQGLWSLGTDAAQRAKTEVGGGHSVRHQTQAAGEHHRQHGGIRVACQLQEFTLHPQGAGGIIVPHTRQCLLDGTRHLFETVARQHPAGNRGQRGEVPHHPVHTRHRHIAVEESDVDGEVATSRPLPQLHCVGGQHQAGGGNPGLLRGLLDGGPQFGRHIGGHTIDLRLPDGHHLGALGDLWGGRQGCYFATPIGACLGYPVSGSRVGDVGGIQGLLVGSQIGAKGEAFLREAGRLAGSQFPVGGVDFLQHQHHAGAVQDEVIHADGNGDGSRHVGGAQAHHHAHLLGGVGGFCLGGGPRVLHGGEDVGGGGRLDGSLAVHNEGAELVVRIHHGGDGLGERGAVEAGGGELVVAVGGHAAQNVGIGAAG